MYATVYQYALLRYAVHTKVVHEVHNLHNGPSPQDESTMGYGVQTCGSGCSFFVHFLPAPLIYLIYLIPGTNVPIVQASAPIAVGWGGV